MAKVLKQGEMNNGAIDLLHDSVLIQILSFLSAKEAVCTCLVSKRWRNLWLYLPSLKFDREEFRSHEVFKRFVHAVLLLRETSHLDTFYIDWEHDSRGSDNLEAVTLWIRHALIQKPRSISINCDSYDASDLPLSLFSRDSLEDLNLLFSYTGITKPELVNLPRLRKLNLGYMTISNDLMKTIISGCNLLEELEILDCQLHISGISSDRLKSLSLSSSMSYNLITINSPNLESLSLIGIFPLGLSLKNMPFLDEAYLFLSSCGPYNSQILNGLSNVKDLELFGSPLKVILKWELQKCPRFNNLKQLTLDKEFEDEEFDIGAIILEHSPNLEKDCIFQNDDDTEEKEEDNSDDD